MKNFILNLLGNVKNFVLNLFGKLPRSWSIIALAILIFFFLLPSFDVGVAIRFVTFFTMSASMGWGALRLFWIERTKEIEEEETTSVHAQMRIIARDISYAVMVTGCIVGSANISL